MQKDDARYSTLEQLHERRKQVVRLHRKGYGVMQIIELSGLSYPTVRSAIDRYREGGLAALKPNARGKRAGQGWTLTEAQEQSIRKIICDKRPEQLKMEFALWNRAAVMQLIECEYGVSALIIVSATPLRRQRHQIGLLGRSGSSARRSWGQGHALEHLREQRFVGTAKETFGGGRAVGATDVVVVHSGERREFAVAQAMAAMVV